MDEEFPILEIEMNKNGFKILLKSHNETLSVTLNKDMMSGIVEEWQKLQSGEVCGTCISRHYTGSWPDLGGVF